MEKIILRPDKMRKYCRTSIFFIALFLVSAFCEFHIICRDVTAGETVFDLKIEGGKITAKLKNAPLEKVLQEILAQSGARIWLSDSIEGDITVEFREVHICNAIRKIMKDKNYALVYTPRKREKGSLSILESSKAKDMVAPVKQVSEEGPLQYNSRDNKKDKEDFELLAKEALDGRNPSEREDAIITLGETKDKKAIEVISKALQTDPDADVRLSSIDALLEIGDESVIDPLSHAVKDHDPWVRELAVEALDEMDSEAAAEFIREALHDEDGAVREIAQEILEELNDREKVLKENKIGEAGVR